MSAGDPFDLDAALARLARAERAARPAVPPGLRTRVLAAALGGAVRPVRPMATAGRRAARGRMAALLWPGDGWARAAVAATIVFLILGLGLGYRVGEALPGLGAPDAGAAADEALAWEGVFEEAFMVAEAGL